jgi:mRNA interferase RelE/StbE
MEKYKVTFRKSAAKDLRSIPKKDINRILACIDNLAKDPRADGCIKLSGQEQYRVRQGLYRFIYEIQDKKLAIQTVKVSHRSIVYKSNQQTAVP